MCDTNKLHQLSVLTDDDQTKPSKTHSFPDQTTSKSFEYTNNYQNDEAVPIPKQISWEQSPPPPQAARAIISNTFTVSTISSSSYNPSYPKSLDVDDDDYSGPDLDKFTSEPIISITVRRLSTTFSDESIESDPDVSNEEPVKDSNSANINDFNMKLLCLESIDENNSDWDVDECNIDIPKLSDTSASLLPFPSIEDDEKKEAETAKSNVIKTRADETNHANEDHKDCEYNIDIPKSSQSSASLPALPSKPAPFVGDNEEKEVEVSKDDVIKTRANETDNVNDDRKDDVEEICVIEQGPDLGKVDEQTPMLYISDNINRKKPPKIKVADSSLSPNAISWPGLPQSAYSAEQEEKEQEVASIATLRQEFGKILKQQNLDLSTGPTKKKKHAPKRKQIKGHKFMPKAPISKFHIPREFTEQILPGSVEEPINTGKGSIYEFIIKKLRIINFRPNEDDISKTFDVGFDGKYLRAKRQHPKYAKGKNKWIMDQIVGATEVKQDDPDILRPPTIVNDTQKCYVQSVLENREKLLAIIKHTKWTKIPIYKRNQGDSQMTLQLTKNKFISNYESFIDIVDTRDITLIPIVMFDYRDKYVVEFVWIVRIRENTDIGISFVYKSNGKDIHKPSVDVAGIYLDKNQILQQHHVISPSSSPERLSDFRTTIDNLYIGDAKDDENRIKNLQKRLNDALDDNNRKTDALVAIASLIELYQ